MLYQLHHQEIKNLNNHSMKMQRDIKNESQLEAFIKQAKGLYPLPEGYQWLMVKYGSTHFEGTKPDTMAKHEFSGNYPVRR